MNNIDCAPFLIASRHILFESINNQDEKVVVKGGKGGLGNWNFKSSTNQTPRYAQPGLSGIEKKLTIICCLHSQRKLFNI